MDDVVMYRERALAWRRLADFGTEAEVRWELRALAAELAAWVVNIEIEGMMSEQLPPVLRHQAHVSPWRWRTWRRWPWRRTPVLSASAQV